MVEQRWPSRRRSVWCVLTSPPLVPSTTTGCYVRCCSCATLLTPTAVYHRPKSSSQTAAWRILLRQPTGEILEPVCAPWMAGSLALQGNCPSRSLREVLWTPQRTLSPITPLESRWSLLCPEPDRPVARSLGLHRYGSGSPGPWQVSCESWWVWPPHHAEQEIPAVIYPCIHWDYPHATTHCCPWPPENACHWPSTACPAGGTDDPLQGAPPPSIPTHDPEHATSTTCPSSRDPRGRCRAWSCSITRTIPECWGHSWATSDWHGYTTLHSYLVKASGPGTSYLWTRIRKMDLACITAPDVGLGGDVVILGYRPSMSNGTTRGNSLMEEVRET